MIHGSEYMICACTVVVFSLTIEILSAENGDKVVKDSFCGAV
jgi:hypothetical protein